MKPRANLIAYAELIKFLHDDCGTTADIMAKTGLTKNSVSYWIKLLHKRLKLIRICEWRTVGVKCLKQVAVYEWNAEGMYDARRKPLFTPAERMARHYAKVKAAKEAREREEFMRIGETE